MSQTYARQTEHPTDSLFVSRWSSRAFTGEPIPDDVLFTSFEAARWAPSGGNAQPWRFIYAKKDSAYWPTLFALLNERNQIWAERASALVLVLSRKTREGKEGRQPLHSHSFDAGAAWSNFAHQASLLGWSTRAIGGFNKDETRAVLEVPHDYALEVFIAVGKAGDVDVLPDDLRASDKPTDRVPLTRLVSHGRFTF